MSGFYYMPKTETDHIATPLHGTWARQGDGQPTDGRIESDYPITAECKICQGKIRLNRLMQMEWRHVPAEVPARPVLRLAGADAENGRGLSLVNALTGGRWWTEPEGGGKVVWVELGAERDVPQ